MTGISFEQLNLYSQLSAELLMPTSIPRSKSSPDSVASICRIWTTGSRIGPNCRCGLSYFELTPLDALKLPSTHISSGNGPRSTTTRMFERAAFHFLSSAGGRIDPECELTARVVRALVLRVDPEDAGLVDERVDVGRRQQRIEVERTLGHFHQAFAEDLDLALGVRQPQRVGHVRERALRV